MITPHQQIRRPAGNTVDIDVHRRQASAERAAMFRSGKRLLAETLMAVAMTLAFAGALAVGLVAVAGMIHIVKVALSGAA